VAVEAGLLLLREVAVGLGLGGVLDLLLVVGHPHFAACRADLGDRDKAHPRTEHPRLDGKPLGLARLAIEVDLFDRADLLAGGIDRVTAAPFGHG
jgi:hypothetical protein